MTRDSDDQPDQPQDSAEVRDAAAPADEAFSRLRASDPAQDAAPDHARLRAEVDRRRSGADSDVVGERDLPLPVTTPPADGLPGDELAAARAVRAQRRSPARWLRVAAAVAAFAVVGGGSFALGRGGSPDAPAQELIALPGSAAPAAATAKLPAGASDMRSSSWFGGRTTFTASGLSDEAAEATAWGFDAASVLSAETAARVAGVLGVSGTPEMQTWGAWTVGPQDGSAPNVSLQPDGLASLSYSDPTRDPWSCAAAAQPVPAQGATPEGAVVDPVAPDCTQATTPGPADADAIASAEAVLRSLGIDPSGYELAVAESGSDAVTAVTAELVLDGQRSGVTWNLSFVADGLQSLFGSLAPVVDLGTYPVIGAASAVDRLSDPRFGSVGGGVMPLAAADDAAASAAAPRSGDTAASAASAPLVAADAPTVPPTPTAGGAIPWPVTQVTLTSARLGFALTTTGDGASLLVPAYEFADADGSTWSVIAVADDRLDFSAAS